MELRARVPRYQKEMLQWLARRDATSVDQVLARELEDVACAYAEELASAIPGFGAAMVWPEGEEGAVKLDGSPSVRRIVSHRVSSGVRTLGFSPR